MLSAGFAHSTNLRDALILAAIGALLWILLRLFVERGGLAAAVAGLVARFPWLSADNRKRRVRRRQVCLACGDGGLKDLRYDAVEKVVLVQCPICLATWGRDPIVQAQKWAKPITEEK